MKHKCGAIVEFEKLDQNKILELLKDEPVVKSKELKVVEPIVNPIVESKKLRAVKTEVKEKSEENDKHEYYHNNHNDVGMCNYNDTVHYTKSAQDYNMSKCVVKTMKKMSSPNSCMAYMSGIATYNPDMKYCSIENIHHICEKSHDFTIEDARKLCGKVQKAKYEFWRERK